jgi:hypothetical protein
MFIMDARGGSAFACAAVGCVPPSRRALPGHLSVKSNVSCASAQFASSRPLGDWRHTGWASGVHDPDPITLPLLLFRPRPWRVKQSRPQPTGRDYRLMREFSLSSVRPAPCVGQSPTIYPVCATAQSIAWRLDHGQVLLPAGGRVGGKFSVRDEPS